MTLLVGRGGRRPVTGGTSHRLLLPSDRTWKNAPSPLQHNRIAASPPASSTCSVPSSGSHPAPPWEPNTRHPCPRHWSRMALVVSKEELCHSLGGLAAWVGGQDPSSAETLAQPQQRKEKDLGWGWEVRECLLWLIPFPQLGGIPCHQDLGATCLKFSQ